MDTLLQEALRDKRMHIINGLYILTDRQEYTAVDQVFPLFGEQQLFFEELQHDRVKGAEALEIGLGSGVLSIGVARAGAKHVTALEINPRAKCFAGFNILLNRVEDKISIVDGHEQIYLPVQGRRFGYILSDPPFEPTPPGMNNFYHSGAGPYGLDFLDQILRGLDEHLTDDGHAEIVTGAPGDAQGPSLLLELIDKHLSGTTTVLCNPASITFDAVMDIVAAKKMGPPDPVEALRQKAAEDGVTHFHLCVIHYDKGPKQLRVGPTRQVYPDFWDLPLPEVSR